MFLDVAFSPMAYVMPWVIISSVVIAVLLIIGLIVLLIVRSIRFKTNTTPKENAIASKPEDDNE